MNDGALMKHLDFFNMPTIEQLKSELSNTKVVNTINADSNDCWQCDCQCNCDCVWDCECANCNCQCGGCFITTATTKSRNLPDDCHELTMLRKFRDSYMKKNTLLNKEVNEYYEIAPVICNNIDKLNNSSEIYEDIYQRWIKSAVIAVENGNNVLAYNTYKEMVLALKKKYYHK